MKTRHYIYLLFLLPVLLYSCAAPYQVSTNVKIKNDWKISDINVEGDIAGTPINAPVFEDVNMQCLKDSKWSFYEEGSGAYTINSSDSAACVKGVRKITWEVVTLKGKSHYLQFYRYGAPKGILTDRFTLYIAEITQLSKSSFTLKYPIKYQGKTGSIVITLAKL